LTRLDKDGRWQTYTKENTKGGLPDDRVWALTLGKDGAPWIGTNGGGSGEARQGRALAELQ
jgi:hypothetical protein